MKSPDTQVACWNFLLQNVRVMPDGVDFNPSPHVSHFTMATIGVERRPARFVLSTLGLGGSLLGRTRAIDLGDLVFSPLTQ